MRGFLRWLLPTVAICGCFYIWHFSLADGERSAITSGRALELINGVLARMGTELRFSHQTVRKIGHFVGYFLLGVLVALALWMFSLAHYAVLSLPLCVVAAIADECVQIFVPGRVAAVSDVMLDSLGAACGILLFSCTVSLVSALWRRRRKKVQK